METIDELIASAEIGDQARKFLESDLGKCVLGMARQQIEEAWLDLENVDPTQTEKIRALQNKAQLGRQFEQWLKELLQEGENAMNIYQSRKDES